MERELREKVKNAVRDYYNSVYKADKKKREYIPVSGKVLGEEELLNMIDASLDMWLTGGRFLNEFEKKFASYLGAKYSLAVNSGSSANLIAMSALMSKNLDDRRLKKGDEVITCACGFPTTVNPIIQNGLIPVFVDCELGTYNIDVKKIEQAISEKTKAIFVAHTLGAPFNLQEVMKLVQKYNLWLIEDSCDALGGTFNGKKLGTVGHIGTYSFYPAHHITMGEGGAVVTSDNKLFKILKSLRDWGRDCSCPTGMDGVCGKRFSQQLGNLPFGYDHKYTYSNLGYNLKITDWQAAIGVAQLDKLNSFLEKRKHNARLLTELLLDLKDYLILPEFLDNSAWFGYLISVKQPLNKQKIVEFLEKNDIGTRQLFAGNLLRQPVFVDDESINFRIANSDILNSSDLTESVYSILSNTDFVMNNTFWVGIYPELEDSDIKKISDVIHLYINTEI